MSKARSPVQVFQINRYARQVEVSVSLSPWLSGALKKILYRTSARLHG
ncbi:MAG TPA: hypothetical protein VJL56_06080 [Candidatus Bathyarchaeia archaeon]|nr:hypothetical protein [Candidatus Bathyarchaeia archaeon]